MMHTCAIPVAAKPHATDSVPMCEGDEIVLVEADRNAAGPFLRLHILRRDSRLQRWDLLVTHGDSAAIAERHLGTTVDDLDRVWHVWLVARVGA